jgi:hypothetical protein
MSVTNPESEAPKAVQEFLAKIGGMVPGQNRQLFRIVLAEHCMIKTGGIFHDLGSEEQSVFAVDAKGKVIENRIRDHVTSAALVEVCKYSCDGWIIERWFPAETWGTPEDWTAHKSEDGTTMMKGEFPSRGDYFFVGGPFPRIPELGDLECAIAMHKQSMEQRPQNYKAHFKQTLLDEATARERRREELEKTLAYVRKNELVPMLKGTSLEAQRFRNQLQTACGLSEHLGAVHDA